MRPPFRLCLRSCDRSGAASRRPLFALSGTRQSHSWRDGWQLSALLSWAEHSGRVHCPPVLVVSLPVGAGACDSLLRQLLHLAPRLSLLRGLLSRCLLLWPQMAQAGDRLHDLCFSIRPSADLFRWLLDQQRPALAFHCGRSTSLTDLVYRSTCVGHVAKLHTTAPFPRQLKPLTFTARFCFRMRSHCTFMQLHTQSRLAHPAPNLLDMVQSLLQWEPSLARCHDARENLPLHFACIFEHSLAPLDLVRLLLVAHPRARSETNSSRCRSIELAQQPSVELMQLLSNGDLVARSASVPDGGTLLQLYCRRRVTDNSWPSCATRSPLPRSPDR